jgi:hypothetical protein
MYNPPTILYTAAAACCSYRREILLNTRPGALQKRGWPHVYTHIYQPPDTTIINNNNNNNRYNVVCVYTCGGYLYYIIIIIIIILCTYIIRAIAYNRRRTGTCYRVPCAAARCLSAKGGWVEGRKTTHVGGTSLGGGDPARRRTDGRTSPSRLSRLCAHTSTGPKENRFYYYYYYCYCYCY